MVRNAIVAFGASLLVAAVLSPVAFAATGTPQWSVSSVSRPTNFAPGGDAGGDSYFVMVTNSGGAASNGPITISDELPEGLVAAGAASGEDELGSLKKTAGANFSQSCGLDGNGHVSCTYTGTVIPDDTLILRFPVSVSEGLLPPFCVAPFVAGSCVLENMVRVSGGDATVAAGRTPTNISTEPAGFGLSPGGAITALSSVQAGAHADLTVAAAFNTLDANGTTAGNLKDTTYDLPAGFAGDLVDTPACPAAVFVRSQCPIGTQVGVTTIFLRGSLAGAKLEPVYNLAPEPGEVASLGFRVANLYYQGGVAVRGPGEGEGYGLATKFHNITAGVAEPDNVELTVWGVPADPSHDPFRWKNSTESEGGGAFGTSSDSALAPFFSNPTQCTGEPLQASFSVASWQQPNAGEGPAATAMGLGPIVGCDGLGMDPKLTAEATTDKAFSPSGLDLAMNIPQTYDNAQGLATSTLKRAVVTLPEGMTVNPSAGAGLGACTEAQYQQEAIEALPGQGCPSNSKLGTVRIVTPSLKEEVTGSVFLAQPFENQFRSPAHPSGSLLALYIVARIPDRGVLVKTAGEVSADPSTGRLVTTFDDLPPLPFSLFTFRFNQGATSPLVTPPACGDYRVTAELTPWAKPEDAPLTPPIPSFPISSAFDDGPCPAGGLPPFKPGVIAGTQNSEGGTYSPTYIRLTRGDGEQEITRFSAQLPPGLTANLSGVPFCSDAAIELAKSRTGAQEETEPSCPAASQVGHTLVGAGVGSVLAQASGKVYMAGPYNGAPFSIVSITSAKVGPFDLGTVVVRVALKIDPTTAVVTVDAAASDPIPHIIDGIVIHVRDIRVYVDRAAFTLNPTSCERMTFSATVDGSGASFTDPADDVPVTVGNPFQAADCQALKFKPVFKASTSAKTSRANGASLKVTLAYPKAPQGSQANIRTVKVSLPIQLPSRLTTLQKACTDIVFAANPAACPPASRIGSASAVTPILPVPLSGPVYFVSHGARAFPDLVIVLQGYGVTIDLRGETFISKKSITSTTFRAVPDQPVTSFQLTLPSGRFSALASIGNLCAHKLLMPTRITAQNGAAFSQSTKIAVAGCAKHKAKAGKHGRKKKK